MGRTEGQKRKRAIKVRGKYGKDPRISPEMLDVLSRANSFPDYEHIEVILKVIPPGSTPYRIMIGTEMGRGFRYNVAAIFDDALMVGHAHPTKKGRPVEVFARVFHVNELRSVQAVKIKDDCRLLVEAETSEGPFMVSIGGGDFDLVEVQSFLEEGQHYWQKEIQRLEGQANLERNTHIKSDLSVEDQLAGIELFRESGMPEDYVRMLRNGIKGKSRR